MIFARLQEAGFTGTLTDKLGRKLHYVDGKRVSGQKLDEVAPKVKAAPPEAQKPKAEAPTEEDPNAVKSPAFIGKIKDKATKFAEMLKTDAKGVLTQLKKDFGLPDWSAEKKQEAELLARASQVSRKKSDVEVPQMGKLVGVTKAKSKPPEFNPRTHLLPEERHLIRKKLGTDGWVLRKITDNDLNAMRDIYRQVRDEGQKAALLHAFDMMSIAKREGGEAYVPKGKLRQRPSVPPGVSPATRETAKEAMNASPPPTSPTPTSPSATPPMASAPATPEAAPTTTPEAAPAANQKGRIGLETPDPNFKQKPGALNTFSAISHRSPKIRRTDAARPEGAIVYANVIHNQLEPTRDEWQALHDHAPKLDGDKRANLGRRLGVNWGEEFDRIGKRPGDRAPRGFYGQVLQKYIKRLIDAGPKGTPPPENAPTRGVDRRSAGNLDKRFPHFRPMEDPNA